MIEVLAVIGIIATVVGLTLPALAGARERARSVKSQSNLHQIGLAFDAYLSDFIAYPFGESGRLYELDDSGSLESGMPIWEFAMQWPLLTHAYTPWDGFWRVLQSPGSQSARGPGYRGRAPTSHYYYANSFLARPALWSGRADPGMQLIAPTRSGSVAFPSQKVMLWDHVMGYVLSPQPMNDWSGFLVNPTPMLFVDGHGDQRRPEDSSEPVVNPLYSNNILGWMRLSNTRDGVQGLDF